MARPRRHRTGVREALRASLAHLVEVYPEFADAWRAQLDQIDAGKPTRCHGYEIDLPGLEWVEVDQDGRVTELINGN